MSVFGAGRAHGLDTPRGDDWRMLAACVGEDPELFQPIGEAGRRGADAQAQEDRAKEVCGRCPAADACLAFALVHQAHGIAGGLNEEERRQLRRVDPALQRAFAAATRTPREMCRRNLHPLTGLNLLTSTRGEDVVVRACRACRDEWRANNPSSAPKPTTRAGRRQRQAVAA